MGMNLDALFDKFMVHPDVVRQPNAAGEAGAWCPWHSDREGGNPSLGVNTAKQIVKCFVCGEGGAAALAKAWGINVSRPALQNGRTTAQVSVDHDGEDGAQARTGLSLQEYSDA